MRYAMRLLRKQQQEANSSSILPKITVNKMLRENRTYAMLHRQRRAQDYVSTSAHLELANVQNDMVDIALPLCDTTMTSDTNTCTQPLPQAGKIAIPPAVTAAYKCISQATGSLGGNGSTGAIYGEITVGSMQHIMNYLKDKCDLTEGSRFIDVGSGLGKPNFHAAEDPAVRLSIGAELERIRHEVSVSHCC